MAIPSFDDPVLRQWKDCSAFLPNAAAAYARIQEMRAQADYYERALLRDLYHEKGLNWREIADVLNANLGSRQATRQKWLRLVSDDEYGHQRRKPGGAGTWPVGKPRRRDGTTS